ncbi:universal stress protein [Aquisalimonas asiatica]|uniref:Nucleotide-binding universal stress protein, UspA family n=1 Tax=Aquisalimonas asiatica TaxID=406100 RepID=A0A1H8VAA1_9GAMM|nr:universal stress protein [Aquisalimonas asiatica]SEP12336.1 Nucleotide-binding universal stress protein, UspA family [Aquisalimonas asiatica]
MNACIQDIIVPVDGSDHAGAAVRYASRLARTLDADIHLVHAFPGSIQHVMETLGRSPGDASAERLTAEAFETLRNGSARRAFQHAREYLGDADNVTEHVLDGKPSSAIAGFVGDGHDVQVVMGRRGLGRVQELLLGSVSERVIQSVHQPVTVVTAGREWVEAPDGGPLPLIVPVDGSRPSGKAAAYAARLAARSGAAIHLLHAFPGLLGIDPSHNATISTTEAEAVSRRTLSHMARQSAEDAFRAARDAMGDAPAPGTDVVQISRHDSPARAINQYVRDLGPAEVILGRRGLNRIESLLGSVSQRVIHGAACPVTVLG